MNPLSRRSFLKQAPVVAAAAGATIAGAATAAAKEAPVTKVNRLGWELAHALDDYDDGLLHAVIYPASKTNFAVGFTYDLHETQEEKVRRLIRNLQFEMSKLPVMETVGGGAHEITFDGGGYLRLGAADAAKDGRLVMVGFVPPLNAGRAL